MFHLRQGMEFLALLLIVGYCLPQCVTSLTTMTMKAATTPGSNKKVVVLGGTGRIGTAVAIHLLQRDSNVNVVLVGRRQEQMDAAMEEVLKESETTTDRVSTVQLETVWDESSKKFQELVNTADCLIHTAGPYLDQSPIPLKLALKSERCKAYVDVSDPLDYLEESLQLSQTAKASNLTALVAAGAFPGMSNVLAKEASAALLASGSSSVQDVRFNYFTAGLGGSGVVNLYITNLGFGEPMVQYDNGKLRFFQALSGLQLGKVDFFVDELQNHPGNERAKERVGQQTVFAWPFPEAATVAKHLGIQGNSHAAMGTAPDIWNVMLGILVQLVPRPFWKNAAFSKFMADFSQPLVLATDALLKQTGTGETHAMRIDVSASKEDETKVGGVSIVQAHDSFRRCVGQSCAEFALDVLAHGGARTGVYLPEQYYEDATDRSRIIEKLTSTPGTFCYTGPVLSNQSPNPPSDWDQAISEANEKEGVVV